MKKTLKIETPEGVFTRKTGTAYTHAVVRKSLRANDVLNRVRAGLYRDKLSGVDARWVKDRGFAVTWHGSEQAARAAAAKPYDWDNETSLVGIFPAVPA